MQLTAADVLVWLTGADRIPAVGFPNPKIKINFDPMKLVPKDQWQEVTASPASDWSRDIIGRK